MNSDFITNDLEIEAKKDIKKLNQKIIFNYLLLIPTALLLFKALMDLSSISSFNHILNIVVILVSILFSFKLIKTNSKYLFRIKYIKSFLSLGDEKS